MKLLISELTPRKHAKQVEMPTLLSGKPILPYMMNPSDGWDPKQRTANTARERGIPQWTTWDVSKLTDPSLDKAGCEEMRIFSDQCRRELHLKAQYNCRSLYWLIKWAWYNWAWRCRAKRYPESSTVQACRALGVWAHRSKTSMIKLYAPDAPERWEWCLVQYINALELFEIVLHAAGW